MDNEQYSELLEYLLTGQLPKEADETYEQWASQFREQNNHIYVEERRLVPRYELSWILSMFHDNPTSAHQGAEAMRQQINKRYVWKGMTSDIKEYVKSCYECQRRGGPKENNRKRFNRTLCEGLAKVAETINDWDTYIQPILFSYRTRELRVTGQPPFTLVYGKNPVLAMDSSSKGQELIERLLEITDKVPQLRTNAKRAIKKAQAKLEETFNKKEVKFQKGDLVLYFDKALAARHDVKFVNKLRKIAKSLPFKIKRIIINLENINNLEEKFKESLRMLDGQPIEHISTMIE